MRSRIRYVFSTMYESRAKNVFLKGSKKGYFMVLNIVSAFICMHHPCLSFQAGHLDIWSVYFLNYWHLAYPFPCSKMVFSDKTHELCIPTSCAAGSVNHKNVVCWGGFCVCLCPCVCILMSIQFQTPVYTSNSEVCLHKAAFVISLVNGCCL